MRPGPRRCLSRREFLKGGVAGAAALCFNPWARWFGGGPLPQIASTLSLAYPHHYFADPDTLPPDAWPACDVLLLPAYAAARLIARGELRHLRGEVSPFLGRPHDPEGAYTLPHGVAFAVLAAPAAQAAAPRSLAELWQAGAVWPDSARLALGAALMRRGYSPNDTHPGHLAQCERDLQALRPRLSPDPAAAVRQGAAALALTVAFGPALPGGLQAALPAEGALCSEYDWVIPRRATRVGAALAFLRGQMAAASHPAVWAARRVPLAPLPAEARAQHAGIWARLRLALST